MLVIRGWVLEKGIESTNTDIIKVVLRNEETGVCSYIPTNMVIRNDITKDFYDGTNYDKSGFEANVILTNDFNLKNDYAILIYLKNLAGKRIINTDATLKSMLD